eukprot:TRINITY_DN3056_c0_g1_i1.p1 TRINITY_DN3056_c0_g1~~TRINITY_DN3056_c0_g1_i1.p1  ORF type:complete len:300 (-),score=76.18 TRINITY_DN3056_c0_g1_i1:116-1015(-)
MEEDLNKSKISRVVLEGIDYFIFLALLKYLYTDHLISVSYHVPKLKVLAERFSLPRLVALCCRHMGLAVKQDDTKAQSTIPPSSWCSDLQGKINSSLYSDLSLLLEDSQVIFVHKVLLAARMSYFKTIFEGNFKEGNERIMTIKELEYEPFLMVLSFVYTNTTAFLVEDKTKDYVLDVLLCAGRFLVEELKQSIEKMLEEQLTQLQDEEADEVFNFLFISESVETPKLRNACMDIISERLSHFRTLEGWNDVSQRYPETVKGIEELHSYKFSPHNVSGPKERCLEVVEEGYAFPTLRTY